MACNCHYGITDNDLVNLSEECIALKLKNNRIKMTCWWYLHTCFLWDRIDSWQYSQFILLQEHSNATWTDMSCWGSFSVQPGFEHCTSFNRHSDWCFCRWHIALAFSKHMKGVLWKSCSTLTQVKQQSSQLNSNLSNWRKRAWKNSGSEANFRWLIFYHVVEADHNFKRKQISYGLCGHTEKGIDVLEISG